MTWATSAQAIAHWPDAQAIATATLNELLQVAFEGCYAYAPALTDRTVADAVVTSGSNLITSATAAFTVNEIGRTVSGAGIPASAIIESFISATAVTLSAAATASGVDVSVTVSGVPTSYMQANIFQARETYAAAQRGEQDVIGIGEYAIRARPLTAAVIQLLRPQRRMKAVG